MTFVATLSEDLSTIAMSYGDWRHTIPVSDLPRWIRLYRFGRDRKGHHGQPGPYAADYIPGLSALERVAAQLREVKK